VFVIHVAKYLLASNFNSKHDETGILQLIVAIEIHNTVSRTRLESCMEIAGGSLGYTVMYSTV